MIEKWLFIVDIPMLISEANLSKQSKVEIWLSGNLGDLINLVLKDKRQKLNMYV